MIRHSLADHPSLTIITHMSISIRHHELLVVSTARPICQQDHPGYQAVTGWCPQDHRGPHSTAGKDTDWQLGKPPRNGDLTVKNHPFKQGGPLIPRIAHRLLLETQKRPVMIGPHVCDCSLPACGFPYATGLVQELDCDTMLSWYAMAFMLSWWMFDK